MSQFKINTTILNQIGKEIEGYDSKLEQIVEGIQSIERKFEFEMTQRSTIIRQLNDACTEALEEASKMKNLSTALSYAISEYVKCDEKLVSNLNGEVSNSEKLLDWIKQIGVSLLDFFGMADELECRSRS